MSVERQLVALLLSGAQRWNEWRKRHSTDLPRLDGIKLEKVNLDGIDLSHISMRNVEFIACSFRNAQFINAVFSGALLRDNDFTGARFIAADFQNADLSGSQINRASILTANTRGASLCNMDFRGHDLGGLDLRGTSLAGSNLVSQVLARLDLSNIDFSNANLDGADLRGANLNCCNLLGASLRDVKLCNASAKGAKLKAVSLRGLDLSGINFDDADLSDCDLREANLSNASLIHATITGAKLWKTETQAWRISRIICDYAYWNADAVNKTSYKKHEFERLYAQASTIELVYPQRLSLQEIATLPIMIEHLQALQWGTELHLKSIADFAGGTRVILAIDEIGTRNPSELKEELQLEAERIQSAQIALRNSSSLRIELKEDIARIKEKFWPRLLELAEDHDRDQVRTLTVVFMDLKDFSSWADDELSEKLALFRGLTKPVLTKWQAGHPNMEGDSVRVTFRNASAGLACACMLQGVLSAVGFEVRIGVELGEVTLVHNEVTEVSDLEGVAVSMAARLEAAADPGQVLASERVRFYTDHRGLFEFRPLRVSLQKSIGDIKKGEIVDCYQVTMKTPPHAV